LPKLKGQTKILINIVNERLCHSFRRIFDHFQYQVYISHNVRDAMKILDEEKEVFFFSNRFLSEFLINSLDF